MHGETTLAIAPDHPALAGHFPGAPIVPGVVLLDAAVHAVMQALNHSSAAGVSRTACQIKAAKFLSPVGPGETLKLVYASAASGNILFDISSGSRKVATGTLALPLAP